MSNSTAENKQAATDLVLETLANPPGEPCLTKNTETKIPQRNFKSHSSNNYFFVPVAESKLHVKISTFLFPDDSSSEKIHLFNRINPRSPPLKLS